MYEGLSDEELILRYRKGEEQVADYLLDKYKSVVRMKARELYLSGGDREDLLQEGMLGLFKAIREYDPSREASFSTYAQLLIDRQMFTAIQASLRQKHQPLNNSVSITELEDRHETGRVPVADSTESIVMDRENAAQLRRRIDSVLSRLEKSVLDLYLDGMDYLQIADRLDRNPKSIDNALQRIRTKVEKLRQ